MSADKDSSVFEQRAEEFQKYKRGDEVVFPTGSQTGPFRLDENFVVPEVNVDPMGDVMIDFLIYRDREDTFIDFKEIISISRESAFAKVAKDIFGFANRGGGFIMLGFRERKSGLTDKTVTDEQQRRFLKVGLPADFHLDQADLQAKFNAYSNATIQLAFREFHREVEGETRKFAVIYVPASTKLLMPIKAGTYRDSNGTAKQVFSEGSVFIRRGTQCVPATKDEITWIKRRAEKEGYRVSILSGQPDEIQEQLYSNMFDVLKLPPVIMTFDSKSLDFSANPMARMIPLEFVYRLWNNEAVTLEDVSAMGSQGVGKILPDSGRAEELATWLSDDDKRRVVTSLLNKELAFRARRLGMLQEPRSQKFYYACDGEYRYETWTTRRGRPSSLKVAGRIWAQQLQRPIYWHLGVEAVFTYLGNEMCLRLNPTIQLTSNGRKAVFGSREGTVITRLKYRWYNATYLTQLLFWIWRLAEGKDSFSLAQGRVVVSAKPIVAGIGVGILHDRPMSEPLQMVPEVELEEELG